LPERRRVLAVMERLARAALFLALALGAAACASSHTVKNSPPHTNAPLPRSLVKLVHSDSHASNVTGKKIEVYGPGSRQALVKASSGDLIAPSASERKARFYLIVLHGHFVGDAPLGAEPPHGTIEAEVWSPTEGSTDLGIGNHLPAAVSRLHRLAVITLT